MFASPYRPLFTVHRSFRRSYDSAHLTTPDIKWLGIRPSDLDRYGLPEQCRLDMTDADISTGKIMIEEDFIKANPKWVKEVRITDMG
jgi:meiotic recombination protein SPO11